MRHHLIVIASNRFLDTETFLAFGEENKIAFGISNNRVSSWYVDDLIKAYREAGFTERLVLNKEENK